MMFYGYTTNQSLIFKQKFYKSFELFCIFFSFYYIFHKRILIVKEVSELY